MHGHESWTKYQRRFVALFLVALLVISSSSFAASKKSAKDDSDDAPVCDIPEISVSSSKGKSNDDSGDPRYLFGGLCVDLSGNIQGTGQAATDSIPQFGKTQSPNSLNSFTIKPDVRIETALPTRFGPLTTAFEIDWSYDTAKGPDQTVNPDEVSASYLGFTVGYTGSLMDFWDGSNFQFSATAPNRSSYLVAYQKSLSTDLTLAAAVEAGPATSRGADAWRLPDTPPYYTARLRYDKNDWTLHASGAFHELEVRGPPLLTGPLEKQNGWAASSGLTIPFDFVAKDDAASMQFTYAVNSSIFLGTQSDVSYLGDHFPCNRGHPRLEWRSFLFAQLE